MTLRELFSEYIDNLREFLDQWVDFFDSFYLIYDGSLSILDIPLLQLALMASFLLYVAYFLFCGYESAAIAFKEEYTGQIYTLSVTVAFMVEMVEGLLFAFKFSAVLTFAYPLFMLLENSH